MKEEENSKYMLRATTHLYPFLYSCTVQRDSAKCTVLLTQYSTRLLSGTRQPSTLGTRCCSLSSPHKYRYIKYGPSLGTVNMMRDSLLRALRQRNPSRAKK